MDMHTDQVSVSVEMVRQLVDQQFPDWRHLPVSRPASQGTDNALFRIGDELVARFPLRPSDEEVIRSSLRAEAQAARELSGCTRFATPEPVAFGEPGVGYPLPWSVQTWLDGAVATDQDPGDSMAFALDVAEFIRDVRAIDTQGRTFDGRGRGGDDLRDHDDWMHTCLRESEGRLDVPRLRAIWSELRELPRGTTDDVMNHSDLIPGNVLVADGRLAGVLDVGGLGAADPALDLVAAWHLLEDGPRRTLRDALDSDELQWERGKAWAFQQAMGVVWYYVRSNPAMSNMGKRTLDRIMTDTAAG